METERNKNHFMQKKKKHLGVFDILNEALIIPYKNINFLLFTFLTSLPLFFFLVYYEILLQKTLLETFTILGQSPSYLRHRWQPVPDHIARKLTKDFSYKLIKLSLLYLGPLHLLELFTVLLIIDSASKVYTEDRQITLKEMINKSIHKTRLKGTFITSIYVLFLSTCSLLGLIWLVVNYYVILRNFIFKEIFAVLDGLAFVLLLTMFLQWSVVWNMSIVISVLEEIYGLEAFAVSAYFSRGSERHGRILMLIFFVWGVGLRFLCLFVGCYEKGSSVVLQISLIFLGNVVKWVACMIYFYDCKKTILDKKVDEEVGREVNSS